MTHIATINTCYLRASVLHVALAIAALSSIPALGQPLSDAERDAAEQRKAQEREAQQRRRLTPETDVRLPVPARAADSALPVGETPCFTIRELNLRGAESARFGWLLDHLNGPDSQDTPLGLCLGANGVSAVVQRANHAVLERGYVTTRVLTEPQDLSGGALALTVVPGRIRRIRFADVASERATAWNAVPARPGDILNLRDIEQALENFKRVPTAEADIEIVPADAPGHSDLVIRWTQDLPLRLSLGVDDSGSRRTGKYQGSVTLSHDHWWTLNDLFYVSLNRDLGGGDGSGSGTHGATVHYSLPVGYDLLAFTASRSRYFQTVTGLSQDYVYGGSSQTQELRWSRLVHRDSKRKTTLHLRAFARQSRNFIDDTEVEVQRRRVGGWEFGAAHRALAGASTLDLNMAYRRGTGAFGSLHAPEERFGEGTSRFALTVIDAELQWPFAIGQHTWRYRGQWRAQAHHTPLTPQDRFAIGGRYTVRGFDGESSLSAERGWLWRNEVSTPLGRSGQVVFIGLDHGQVGGPSSEWLVGKRLTGAVIGLRGAAGLLQYELFAGSPLHKPDGFRTAHMTAGFWVSASF
jgi:hemolysin activation/secretion protein